MAEDADVAIQPIMRADFVPAKVFRSRSMNTRRGGEGSPLVVLANFFFNISVARYYITSLNDCANVNGEKIMLAFII